MTEGFDLETRLEAAIERRRALFDAPNTNCCRLLTGDKEGVPGLVAERFGEVVILQQFKSLPEERLHQAARFYADRLGVRAVYRKYFVRDRDELPQDWEAGMRSPTPFLGEPVPEEITVLESGLCFGIRPYDGFSVGLFLDQRDNRARLTGMAAGKDLLNLFAYTCPFSIAGAAGGAASTASVDIAPRFLEWGRRNFELNNLPLDRHLFFKSDAGDFLRRAKRQGRSYDVIILDPPSFAHARRGSASFSVQVDLPELIRAASEVLRPAGTMFMSTNHRKITVGDLELDLRRGAGARRHTIIARPRLPDDFAMDPDHAKSIWATFDGPGP